MSVPWLQKCYGPWRIGKWNWLLVRRHECIEPDTPDTTEAGFYERLLKEVEQLTRLSAFQTAMEVERKYDKATLIAMRMRTSERVLLAMMADRVKKTSEWWGE